MSFPSVAVGSQSPGLLEVASGAGQLLGALASPFERCPDLLEESSFGRTP
jgi:hypothetical protein